MCVYCPHPTLLQAPPDPHFKDSEADRGTPLSDILVEVPRFGYYQVGWSLITCNMNTMTQMHTR